MPDQLKRDFLVEGFAASSSLQIRRNCLGLTAERSVGVGCSLWNGFFDSKDDTTSKEKGPSVAGDGGGVIGIGAVRQS